MIIHCSHSKKDLIQVCSVFNIEIEDMYDLSKMDLSSHLEYVLENMGYIEPEHTYYFINNLDELITHLEEPNQSKFLTIAEKERVIDSARNIILFCKNGYNNLYPYFRDEEDLKKTAEIIRDYGDISTCRRALHLLRPYKKISPPIEPIISKRVKIQIERKRLLKGDGSGGLLIKKGKVSVSFD
jgi:hypothetical protein